jgi:23S rRNA (guanosine2251-2'-O)-methyltransferase
MDDRVKEMLSIVTQRGIPVMEVTRPELDRMAGFDGVHQGVALKVPPYEYAHPQDLLEEIIGKGRRRCWSRRRHHRSAQPRRDHPLHRRLRRSGTHHSAAPFGRRQLGRVEDERRRRRRVPVAMAPNLTTTLKEFKKQGVFVLGLDGGGDVALPQLELADRPVVIVVGSEGKGCRAGHRDVRPDRVDPDLLRRVAQRRHRGIRRAVPGLHHPRRVRVTPDRPSATEGKH